MKIANIPFINTAPYFHTLDGAFRAAHQFVADSPRDLGTKAREGAVDAGLLSLVDLWRLESEGLFEPLGSLGIAGHGPILSILLFGTDDPASLEGRRIAVSGQTSTSAKLLALWLKERAGVRHWTPVALGEESDAALLIADQALTRRLSASKMDKPPIDLCEEWTRWTGLPFVFARWAARVDLPQDDKAALLDAVEKALSDAQADWAGLAARLSLHSGFPAAFVEMYLRGIHYRLGEKELEGAKLFKQKLKKAGLEAW